MPQKSSFAKLFSSDAQDDRQLQKIRNRIYYFAWSRDRRDEAKLDWVVSENGVNRNVSQRWIEGSPRSRRDHIDLLPCWLLLANKQISADFIRFIYSVNDLDILVDLKADHTKSNQDKLDKIVTLLQNANFQSFTRSARVRIHFPDKYPLQDLPVFNQYALDNIAVALDGFQQLTHLSVRIVPMQGPEVYELRLATFPFYPMSMTNWSIRMLNSNTFNWDFVGGEQLHHLNLAWDLFQETGSLTATVPAPDDAERSITRTDQASGAKDVVDVPKKVAVSQKKNGSQKRKGRKLKALTTTTASNTVMEVPSNASSLRSSSPSLDHSKHHRSVSVSVSGQDSSSEPFQSALPTTGIPHNSAREPADLAPTDHNAAGAACQISTSASSTKLENTSDMKHISGSEINDGAEKADNAEQRPGLASPINTVPEENMNLEDQQEASPPSSAPSSVTLGRDQSEDEAAIDTIEGTPQVETTMRGAGVNSDEPVKKKRRNRKKGKKTQLTDTAAIPSNDNSDQQIPAESEDNGRTFFLRTSDAQGFFSWCKNWETLLVDSKRTFPLGEIVELTRTENERVLEYKRANGMSGFLARSSDLDRLLRQKERMAAQETERQAEKMRVKGKRKIKKVKEVLIRRKGSSNGLRRQVVEDKKQPTSGKQESDLRKRLKEITAQHHEEEAPVASDISEGDGSSDEDNLSQGDEWSSPERADYPPRHSQIHHQDHQIDEQHLVEELGDSDDGASVISHYGDEGPQSVSDDESENPNA